MLESEITPQPIFVFCEVDVLERYRPNVLQKGPSIQLVWSFFTVRFRLCVPGRNITERTLFFFKVYFRSCDG
jgi:hypothetical protein